MKFPCSAMHSGSFFLGCLAAVLVAAAPEAWAQTPSNSPRPDMWVPNNPVLAVAESNGIVYIGGYFSYVGPYTGSGALLDATTAALAARPSEADNTVRAACPDGSGGWFIGGSFTQVQGVPRAGLAHVFADGTLDTTWAADVNLNGSQSGVQGLRLAGGTLYVGGFFTTIGSQSRNRLAALDPATGNVLAWNPNVTGGNNTMVRNIIVAGGVVYVGGNFTTIGADSRSNLAAIDAGTGTATAWAPNPNNGVRALVLSGNILYVGGHFTTISAATRNYIAAFDTTTGSLTAWDPNSDNWVDALAVSGNTVFAGGWFANIGTAARSYIAALDANTGVAVSGWSPGANNGINWLEVQGSTLYVAGWFSNIAGQAQTDFAGLDTSSGSLTWAPADDDNDGGLVITPSGSTVYVGGYYLTSIGGVKRNRLAALDEITGQATAWNPNADSDVDSLAVSGDGKTVYAGGYFTSLGTGQSLVTRNRIAAIDATPGSQTFGLATNWDPNANGAVMALAVSGSTVYAGGYFNNIGGAARNYIAALDAGTATNNATAWQPDASGGVLALAVSGTTIYAGGYFTYIGGAYRNRIAALDATLTGPPPPPPQTVLFAVPRDGGTVYATSWDPNANSSVYSLAVSGDGSTVYAGGYFTSLGTGESVLTRNYIAAIDATSAVATAWDPNADGYVNALALDPNAVYAGGGGGQEDFANIGGQARNNLASLDPTTGNATAWNPNPDSGVNAIQVTAQAAYVGAYWWQVNGRVHPYFGAFPFDTTAPTVTALSPANNATGVAVNTNLGMTFSENIYKGAWGFIIIKKKADDSVFQQIAVTDASVSVSGNTATITLAGPLAYVTGYYVQIGNQCFKDASGNYYAGIADKTTWSFTTTKATATVTLGNLSQTYDGTPKSATATTNPAGLAVSFTYNGTTTPPTLPGSYAVVGTINDPTYQGSASGTLVINLAATATANASPSSGIVPLQVSFAGSATGLGSGLSYSWNFGDGTAAGSGQNVTHTFSSVGTYNVVLTVTDSNGVSVTGSVSVSAAAGDIFPLDRDKDGFPDEIETALGSDPNDPNSRPFGLPSPVPGSNPAIRELQIRLDFAHPASHDSLTIQGQVRLRTDFKPQNQYVIVDIGGVVRAFVLDAHGRAKNGNDQFRLSGWTRKGQPVLPNATYSMSLRKGTFAAALQNRGFVNASVEFAGLSLPVIIILDGQDNRTVAGQNYHAKEGLWGRSE